MQGSCQAQVAWAAALDALEANLNRIKDWLTCSEYRTCDDLEGIDDLARDDAAWRVPADLPGQIPSSLVPRAQAIAMRQSPVRAALMVHLEARHSRPRPPQPRSTKGIHRLHVRDDARSS